VLQLSSAAHFVLTTHTICPEHGEAIEGHSGSGAEAGHTDSGAVAGRSERTTVWAQRGHEVVGAHGHEHCLLAGDRRNDAVLARRTPRIEPLAARAADTSAADHARGLGTIPLLLVAPKSSPPIRVAV
jgi:hypothetical protein